LSLINAQSNRMLDNPLVPIWWGKWENRTALETRWLLGTSKSSGGKPAVTFELRMERLCCPSK